MKTNDEKVRENWLRRMAARQGLRLEASRRRDPNALDFGEYRLIDSRTRTRRIVAVVVGLDALEAELLKGRGGVRDNGKR